MFHIPFRDAYVFPDASGQIVEEVTASLPELAYERRIPYSYTLLPYPRQTTQHQFDRPLYMSQCAPGQNRKNNEVVRRHRWCIFS